MVSKKKCDGGKVALNNIFLGSKPLSYWLGLGPAMMINL